ncbi:hypothetical protein MRX96_059722 [Rhipicephalus microplus]
MAELGAIEQQARDQCLALIEASTPGSQKPRGPETLAELRSFQEVDDGEKADVRRLPALRRGYIDWHREFQLSVVQGYPNILEYVKRFEQLPNIQEYFTSNRYTTWPILGYERTWGYKKSSR